MSLIQASVTANASVVTYEDNLATTLYLREKDRAGSALTTHAQDNYLNFVVNVSAFTNLLNIVSVDHPDLSGVSDAFDTTNALTWTSDPSFCSACTLYDVRFTSAINTHGSINISSFLNIDQGGVNEPEVTFSGTGVTVGSSSDAGVLDATSGSVALACGVASESSTTVITPSVKVNYSVANSVLLVAVKEDNILAEDSIAFTTAPDVTGAGVDILKASTSFGDLSGSNNVDGDVTAVSMSNSVVTAAVQRLLDTANVPDLADLNDISGVRNALNNLATDSSGATFKGLIGVADSVQLDSTTVLGGSTETASFPLTPQIFFHEYRTDGSNLIASASSDSA